MKTILLATDFSANANQVAQFAAQLAYDQKSTLILFHAFHVWPDNAAKVGDFPLSVEATREASEKALHRLAAELHELVGLTVPIRCLTQEGHTMNAIWKVTKAEQVDLLIMSTVGSAPQSAQLLGSLATEMITETEVPILLIPPGITYTGLKNIVLGIDLIAPPDAVVLDKTLKFARLFGSVIDVLCISEEANEADLHQRAEHIRRLLNTQPHTLTIEISNELYDTLLGFAHLNKADLIIMLPKTRNWFQKLLAEGRTQHMARLTDLPLLAVV